MSDELAFTVRELAEVCGAEIADPARLAARVIRRVATIEEADAESITWVVEAHHAKAVPSSRAAAVLGTKELLGAEPRGLLVADPEAALADILDRFQLPPERPGLGVHQTAVVHPSARIASTAAIGAYAVIHADAAVGEHTVIHEAVSVGRGVRIGQDCEIFDRCVVYDRCRIGDRVRVHAGTVIGADGFGYIFRGGKHRKLAHVGTVIIEDDVEIGANTCIDRAKVGATVIGRGTKIDNLVMIAHNCRLGPLCVLAGQVGLAGSVRLGTGVAMGGQSGVTPGLILGDAVRVAAKTAVTSDIPDGQVVMGSPARERMSVLRDQARVRRLPKLIDELAELRRRMAELEAAANHREPGRG